jgi:hypothetical protein
MENSKVMVGDKLWITGGYYAVVLGVDKRAIHIMYEGKDEVGDWLNLSNHEHNRRIKDSINFSQNERDKIEIWKGLKT